MKHLILLNDPPYGTERSFNGLRMAQRARPWTSLPRRRAPPTRCGCSETPLPEGGDGILKKFRSRKF